ncbi:MAG: hypothetical protein NVSMB48_08800 [Marmoricola sp.]
MRPTRSALRWILVASSFLVLACLVFWPVAPWSSHVIVDCACEDPAQEVWFLHWTSWAVLNGHNPFLTSYLQAPSGVNLALNTSFPLLGFLALPVTATAGPLVSYNLLLRLALATSALSMYGVLRRYTQWWPAAYAGGLLYGFSAYMIGHSHRHLFLTFVPLLPLVIPVVEDWLVTQRRSAWKSGILLGLLIAGEFLISPEIAFLGVIAGVLGLLVLVVRYPAEARGRLRTVGVGLATCGTTLLVGAAYPAYLLVAGPHRPSGAIHATRSLYGFSGDLLAPLLATPGEFFHLVSGGGGFVKGSVQENGFYLGIPLVVMFLVFAWWCRRSSLVLAATCIAVVMFVIGLGPTLQIDGTTVLHWMPFRVFASLPLAENVEPARLSLFTMFGVAIVVAVGLDRLHAGLTADRGEAAAPTSALDARWLRTGGVVVIAAFALVQLVPRVPFKTARVTVPAYFTSRASDTIPQGALALTYPYSMSPIDAPMLWQSASGMRFRMFGGMAFVPYGPHRRSTWAPPPPSPPNIDALLLTGRFGHTALPTQVPGLATQVAHFLAVYRVQMILVDPTAPRASSVTAVIIRALGGIAPQRVEGMDVWLLNRD